MVIILEKNEKWLSFSIDLDHGCSMDLAYRLFNISWDGSIHRGESWEKF